MIYYARSHIGYVRNTNEDSIYVPENGVGNYVAVADGMGGHKAGEIASKIVIDSLTELLGGLNAEEITGIEIKKALEEANQRVWYDSKTNNDHRGMGSTATVAAFRKNIAVIGHVGDSRAYILSGGSLKQITKDHSYVQMLVDSGYITKAEAENHPNKNIITKSIGIDCEIEIDIYEVIIKNGEIILLCTDGLNSVVSDEKIADILSGDVEKAAERLVDMSLSLGGPDNVSVVIAYMDGESA
jgi:PPM family protein phosphatase